MIARGLTLLLLLLSGCSKEPAEQPASVEPVLLRQYRQESVIVIVSASETNIPTAGKIQLMVDVHTPPETEVSFPEIEPFIEPFTVIDGYTEPIQILPNGKHLHRRVWMLAPFLSGEAVFQSFEIFAGSSTIETEPIAVQVTSLLPADLDDLEIRDIAESAVLLSEKKHWWQYWLILAGVVALADILFLTIRSIHKPKPIPVVPPHEVALKALQNLPDDPTLRIHELSRVLKTYVEARYRLPIAGKTVPELVPALEANDFGELLGFLNASEQVRFSNKLPDGYADDVEQFVRSFIDTAEQEVQPCD